MTRPLHKDHALHLEAIRETALAAADAAAAVTAHLQLEGNLLSAGRHTMRLRSGAAVYLIALGKAAPAMSRAAAGILEERLSSGVATLPKNTHRRPIAGIIDISAGHPLPDEGSLAAGRAVAELLATTRPVDLVLVLISGGGSAMLELPHPGISLDDLRKLNTLLLRSGAPIEDINLIRKSISQLKAGGLARMAAPAGVVALILSDVVDDPLTAIASGPTVLRRVRREQARLLIERLNLWAKIPAGVRAALGEEDVRPTRSRRPLNLLIGSNRQIVRAAAEAARQLGFQTRVLTTRMRGEAREVGRRFARRLKAAKDRPVCLLMGGETTVTVRGTGSGGRNQELALAAALELAGQVDVALMALATDGIDGPTDAAGAIIDGATVPGLAGLGLDPQAALEANDSHPALAAAGALFRSGPTGTNLNDLVVGLAYR